MKILLSIIITILTFGCQEDEQLDTHYEILSGACGTLTFKDKIGNDINSASDSLEILRQELLTGGCPGRPCHNYYIEKRKIEVNFNKDRRDFYGFIF